MIVYEQNILTLSKFTHFDRKYIPQERKRQKEKGKISTSYAYICVYVYIWPGQRFQKSSLTIMFAFSWHHGHSNIMKLVGSLEFLLQRLCFYSSSIFTTPVNGFCTIIYRFSNMEQTEQSQCKNELKQKLETQLNYLIITWGILMTCKYSFLPTVVQRACLFPMDCSAFKEEDLT